MGFQMTAGMQSCVSMCVYVSVCVSAAPCLHVKEIPVQTGELLFVLVFLFSFQLIDVRIRTVGNLRVPTFTSVCFVFFDVCVSVSCSGGISQSSCHYQEGTAEPGLRPEPVLQPQTELQLPRWGAVPLCQVPPRPPHRAAEVTLPAYPSISPNKSKHISFWSFFTSS